MCVGDRDRQKHKCYTDLASHCHKMSERNKEISPLSKIAVLQTPQTQTERTEEPWEVFPISRTWAETVVLGRWYISYIFHGPVSLSVRNSAGMKCWSASPANTKTAHFLKQLFQRILLSFSSQSSLFCCCFVQRRKRGTEADKKLSRINVRVFVLHFLLCLCLCFKTQHSISNK